MRSYLKSLELYERALKVTPGGAQTSSKAPGAVGPIGAFPLYLSHGDGCAVIDVDGNRFVDWFNGNCAVTLGHNDHSCSSGPLLSLPTQLEVIVAEALVEAIPCAEQVRFVKTGSEATEAAIRVARAATGRDGILIATGHYHSWHSWYTVTKPQHPGVPEFYGCGVDTFDGTFPDLDRKLDDGIAAIMIEPVQLDEPPPGYLDELVRFAHIRGALVIFDEMISGVRWGLGGYQAHVGVTPDLATFGKAYANGHPLGFLAGPADLMRHASVVSGTFGGELHSLEACRRVIVHFRDLGALECLRHAGRTVLAVLRGCVASADLPATVVGTPARFALQWSDEVLKALWQQELAERGVLAHPSGFNPSAVHNSAAIGVTVAAITEAAMIVGECHRHGNAREALRGELLRAPFARPA